MKTSDKTSESNAKPLSAYERKMARERPGLISKAVLDAVAKEHGSYFFTQEKKSSPSHSPR
jgi:hypothetical protein